MALILISGISTSGKSTAAVELSKLGYEAIDTEHNGSSAWYNKKSGQRVAGFNEAPERTKEWLDQHEWIMSVNWVKEMHNKARHKHIFLCGGASNEAVIRDLCDKAIWLKTSEETIRKRVSIPRDHDYGTKAHELDQIIRVNKLKEEEYRKHNGIIIDATRPIDEVIKSVLAVIEV